MAFAPHATWADELARKVQALSKGDAQDALSHASHGAFARVDWTRVHHRAEVPVERTPAPPVPREVIAWAGAPAAAEAAPAPAGDAVTDSADLLRLAALDPAAAAAAFHDPAPSDAPRRHPELPRHAPRGGGLAAPAAPAGGLASDDLQADGFRDSAPLASPGGPAVPDLSPAAALPGPAATPEPGTWMLMLVGFGLAGLGARRRLNG